MLIEGAVELIIEDVVAVVDGDWEMMAAIFVLELDAVRGVVGIGDFTVYVSDGDGCQGTTYLNDVDIARKEPGGSGRLPKKPFQPLACALFSS